MKKFTALFLALILSLTLVLPAFADDGQVTGYFTVLWSEADEDGRVHLIISQQFGSTATLVVSRDGDIKISSDGSAKGDALLKAVQNGERIHAGSVIALTWSGLIQESFPVGLPDITAVEFTGRDADIAWTDVQSTLNIFNDMNETDEFKLLEDERGYFKEKTLFTVVGSIYRDDGYYEMAISYREWIFSVSDNEFRWYYTTANVSFDLEKTRLALTSDHSETGNAALKAVFDHEMIPFGTVVEVTWEGTVMESYPPQLGDISSFRFTDKQTDYTLEEIAGQADEMNKMRTSNFYPLPDGVDLGGDDVVDLTRPTAASSQEEEFTVTDFTVVGSGYIDRWDCYELAISNKRYAMRVYGPDCWSYTTSTIGLNDIEVSSDGSDIGNAALEAAKNNEPIPLGTVIEMTWSGPILESFPPTFMGITAVKFTGKKTDYSLEEMAVEAASMNEMRPDDAQFTLPDADLDAWWKMLSDADSEDDSVSEEFTILYSERPYDGEYYQFVVAKKTGGKISQVAFMSDTGAELTSDGSDLGNRLLELYQNGKEIPSGAVIEVSYSGNVIETFPAIIAVTPELKFTGKTTDVTEKEAQEELDALNALSSKYDYKLSEEVESLFAAESGESDEIAVSSADGDYPPLIMVDGRLYQLSAGVLGDVGDSDIIGYTTSYTDYEPSKDGEQNFSRTTGQPFARAGDDIAVFYDNEWHLFAAVSYSAPEAERQEQSENPKTGASGVFAGIALAGVLAWAAAAAFAKNND